MNDEFDYDEAYERLSSALEDGSGRISVRLTKGRTGSVITVQIDRGIKSKGCFAIGGWRGGFRPEIRRGMEYRIVFSDPDVRRALTAMWAELDRQGFSS
jgi:hypothetical protein